MSECFCSFWKFFFWQTRNFETKNRIGVDTPEQICTCRAPEELHFILISLFCVLFTSKLFVH